MYADLAGMLGTETKLMLPAIALGFMLLEYLLSRLAHHDDETHDLAETAATLGIAAGRAVFKALDAAIISVPFVYAYSHRLFDFSARSTPALIALFLAVEFAYYWHHRASHRIRWLWATHSVHHSPTKLNLTSGVRLGWTSAISGHFVFYLPLAYIGFHPFAIVSMLGLNLFYQFFVHTEFSPRLGPLECVLNTPTHHRVHHASNASCLDRNYGGVLILFDRLFGTFATAPANEPLRYGLVGAERLVNPLKIVSREWIAMARDVMRAETLREKARILYSPPGATRPVARAKPQRDGADGQSRH